ncbi:hypothetical protein GYMLUDRAFT_986296 [Collybiopsis luxurians FD-317 M1]|uniref:Uncharacterized protein n=1 Tax=Collybiopsis luxurians FD-317 M1 TaxID=944289 RepID=A0A0D0CL40_9AGAR|nr:hypothetical protein GYMLUDRAFT_986296 [Collybiopsis luxurians FD-317 M1]
MPGNFQQFSHKAHVAEEPNSKLGADPPFPAPNLPQELIDRIVDDIPRDLFASRPNAGFSVPSDRRVSFCYDWDSVDSECEGIITPSERLHAVLVTSPQLRALAQVLRIRASSYDIVDNYYMGYYPRYDDTPTPEASGGWLIQDTFLHKVSLISNLQSIELEGAFSDGWPDGSCRLNVDGINPQGSGKQALQNAMTAEGITSLAFRHVKYSLYNLVKMLSSPSTLKHLRLCDVKTQLTMPNYDQMESCYQAQLNITPVLLQSLACLVTDSCYIARLLLPKFNWISLRKLEELRLLTGPSCLSRSSEGRRPAELLKFTNLHTLHFNINIEVDFQTYAHGNAPVSVDLSDSKLLLDWWCHSIESSLPLSRLRKVKLDVCYESTNLPNVNRNSQVKSESLTLQLFVNDKPMIPGDEDMGWGQTAISLDMLMSLEKAFSLWYLRVTINDYVIEEKKIISESSGRSAESYFDVEGCIVNLIGQC